MKGIYQLCINDKCYIGKDSKICDDNRFQTHISELRRQVHWSKELQKDFNLYGMEAVTYSRLETINSCTDEFLCEREMYYINLYDTYNTGYNQTLGGIGMRGYRYTEEQLEEKSKSITGELNPQSKITNKQFFEMVELFKEGYTNEQIADIYNLHSRYVSLIRHKKRFKRLWEQVTNYSPKKSSGQRRGLTYEQFKIAVSQLEEGWTNKAIEGYFGLSSGTGSRIRNKKLYKEFWQQYSSEQERSTTIPLDLK